MVWSYSQPTDGKSQSQPRGIILIMVETDLLVIFPFFRAGVAPVEGADQKETA